MARAQDPGIGHVLDQVDKDRVQAEEVHEVIETNEEEGRPAQALPVDLLIFGIVNFIFIIAIILLVRSGGIGKWFHEEAGHEE